MKKNLVAYYSWQGNTKVVAEEISRLLESDIVRIEEIKERKNKEGMASAAMSALFGLQSRLKTIDLGLEGYDDIYLGGQVWAGHSTPAINSFIKKAELKNKNIYLFITKAEEKDPSKVINSITERINKKGGKVVSTFCVTTKMNQVISPKEVEEQLKSWIENLNSPQNQESETSDEKNI